MRDSDSHAERVILASVMRNIDDEGLPGATSSQLAAILEFVVPAEVFDQEKSKHREGGTSEDLR